MPKKIKYSQFAYQGDKKFSIKDAPTKIDPLYDDKKDYKKILEEYREEINERQNMMYAHNRYGLLLVFQAMDAAGKDGTIRHVLTGVNPHGLQIFSFKKPSSHELDHDFLWRTNVCLPERGRIGIFNRSYYEEVLVVKVHPEILTKYQRIPKEHIEDVDTVWEERYEDIRNLERYASRNGIHVVKFFLHVSKEEQKERFLARIDEPAKNWKFAESDVKERGYWDDYQQAYQDMIRATATPHAPWYVVPADDKKSMRLIVSQVILDHLKEMNMHYPKVDDARRAELQNYRAQLENEE
ncbi:MAG: polyphosphate kinase 2 family protein [Bacteroidia bacterium]